VSELYRPSDHCLSAKLVPSLSDRGCHVVSVTDPYGRILGFLDRISVSDSVKKDVDWTYSTHGNTDSARSQVPG
jgi:CBS-domain-containing membrane protein